MKKEEKMKKVKKLTMVMAVLAVLAIGVGPALAIVIPNGDFEGGNTGFTSAYTYYPVPATPDSAYAPPPGLFNEGTYGVGSDPSDYHISWATFGAHGGDMMMIVNGDTQANVNVWASPVSPATIDVTPDQTYYFGAWLTSVYPAAGNPPIAPATLAFSINGIQIGSDFQLSANVGVWQLFYEPWVADASGTASLSLINRNTVASGNDFALDDITFTTRPPDQVPEPTTMLLLGLGLVGLVGVRRKIQK